MEALDAQAVDGIIVIAPNDNAVRALGVLPPTVPVVAVEAEYRDQPVVAIDQREGARLATRHLLDLGHRTVWHLAGPQDWREAVLRLEGWRATLSEAGAEVPAPLSGDWSPRSGYDAGVHIAMRDDVTAVFAANDQMALGLLHALAERGRRVPEDVSVVGFDDIPEAEFFRPSLTTVHQDFNEVGRRGLELLLARIDHADTQSSVSISPSLVSARELRRTAPRRAGTSVRVAVVGATGHIGSYLVPMLVSAGHDVLALSRGRQQPYLDAPEWEQVDRVVVDRDAEDRDGSFRPPRRRARRGRRRRPGVLHAGVRPAAARRAGRHRHLPAALRHGLGARHRRDGAGARGRGARRLRRLRHPQGRRSNGCCWGRRTTACPPPCCTPGTSAVPGGTWSTRPATSTSRSGDGWPRVSGWHCRTSGWRRCTTSTRATWRRRSHWPSTVATPRSARPSTSCPRQALTLRGYAEGAARWFGREADLGYVPWEEFRDAAGPEHAQTTWEHIARSPSMSIEKARSRLGYQPRYTSLATALEAVRRLVHDGHLKLDQSAAEALETFDITPGTR